MKTLKACIFDLDGVIVDTAKYHYLAWRELANSLGFDFSIEENEKLKGVSRMTSLNILLSIGDIVVDDNTKLKLAEKKNKQYVGYITKMTRDEILPGVIDFINELKTEKIKLALGSASKNAVTILEQVGLNDVFEAIMDGHKITKAKPDPEIFIKAAEELGEEPNNCIVFEDAEAGIVAAINGGFDCIGIGSPQILDKANKVIDGFEGFNLKMLKDIFYLTQ